MALETLLATQRIIDSVWTARYVLLPNDTVYLLSYSRDDEEGYQVEGLVTSCKLQEYTDEEATAKGIDYRTVKTLVIGGVEYPIANPKNIFQYPYSPEAIDHEKKQAGEAGVLAQIKKDGYDLNYPAYISNMLARGEVVMAKELDRTMAKIVKIQNYYNKLGGTGSDELYDLLYK